MCIQNSYALSFNESKVIKSDKVDNGQIYPEINFIDLKAGPIIVLNGKENETFWEFQSIEKAFAEISIVEKKLIDDIKSDFNLDEFAFSNWHSYEDVLEEYAYISKIEETDEHLNRFTTFLTVCDNVERNKKIVELASQDDFDTQEMRMLLPYFSSYVNDYEVLSDVLNNNIRIRANFNVNRAINYATNWANSYNMYQYRSWPAGDCANFASQIARAGGATIVRKGRNSLESWYYDNHNDDGQSLTWVRADNFVRRWGYKTSTTDFSLFSQRISKGDFIAYDKNRDGKYNHIAFVTHVGIYGKYGTSYYKDFKIAQHTNNYHLWVSSSGNDWEELSNTRFVVIRAPY